MAFAKLFTLAEAQALIPVIEPKLAELVSLKQTLDEKQFDVYKHQYFGGMGPNGQKFFPTQMEHLVEIVAELNGMGIEIKDLNTGLIDFPFRRLDGEIVFLCFRHGEPSILAWHTIEGGFAGRQLLQSL